MALRDKLRERAQPHLQPGEQIQQVFLAQTGPSPYFIILTYLTALWNKYFIVVVTDRSITILRAGLFKATFPKGPNPVQARLPRATRIGPLSGLWAKTTSLGPKVWIHKRFHSDVEAADAAIGGSAPVAPPPPVPQMPPPPPPSP